MSAPGPPGDPPSSSPPPSPGPPSWLPSHVQVTVVEARALRAKGGPAGEAFSVALQLGAQRLRTGLARQPKGGGGGGGAGGPRWAEECLLQLPPPLPPPPPEALLLRLTVWQRALVGPDRFLGCVALPLGTLLLLQGGRSAHQERWYKLQSKPGKKEKDRGEIKVSLQFTRHSLTASMFDLSVKDKPRSPFRKLKDKVRGRQKYDLESASAIVPSSSGALGGGGDDDDDNSLDLGVQKGKPKGSGFFFRNKLRKSSLTQSNTSLGSDSTLSSVGSAAGTGMPERMTHSPSRHSSLSMEHSGRDFLPSPKLTHKRAFSDEVSQVKVLSESKSIQSVKPQQEPISRSSLCINGSHVYCEEESSPKKPPFPSSAPPPPSPFPPPQSITPKPEEEEEEEEEDGGPYGRPPGLPPEPDLPPWPSSSSRSSSSGFQKGPPQEPPRFIPSPPILAAQEEDKLSVKTIALNKHRGRVKREEESLRASATQAKPVQIATPIVFPAEVIRVRPQEEAPKREVAEGEKEEEKGSRPGFFFRQKSSKDGRRSSSTGAEVSTTPSAAAAAAAEETQRQEKSRGRSSSSSSSGSWFGPVETKDPPQRPSSPPGLLATTDFATDPACSEDCGPSPFGKPQPEAGAPPQHSDSEPPPAAAAGGPKPPSEWDDNFDAFATSRLRPESGGGGPPPAPPGLGAMGVGSLEGTGPSETQRGGGHFCGTTEDKGEGLCFGSPDLLNFGPEERGAGGSQDRDSGEAALPRGVACEEDCAPESPTGAEHPGGPPWGDLEPEEAPGTPWRRERRQSSERMSAVVLGQALERESVRRPSAVAVATASFPSSAVLFQEEGEAARAGGAESAQPAITSWLRGRSQSASEADRGAPLLAGLCPAGAESQEDDDDDDLLGPIPSGPGEANLPVGPDAREEEEHGMILEVQEQGGSGEQRAGTPPPKPPRRLAGFSLEEEGSQAVWGSLEKGEEGAAPCHLPEVAQERPSMGEEAKTPLGMAAPLTPEAMPVEAGGQGGRLAPQDGSTAPADQRVFPGAALAFEACPPSQHFLGGFSGAQEKAALPGEEEEEEEEGPSSSSSRQTPLSRAVRLPGLPEAFQSAKELPSQEGEGASGARPSSRAPQQALCLTPSLLFWTALEEQQLLQTPLDRPEPERLGEEGPPPPPPPPPGPRAGEALGPLAGGPAGQPPPFAPSPYPELLAGSGMARPSPPVGSGSELGLSSSWPGDWALDFRKAEFWQADQQEGQQWNSSPGHGPAMTPGNPFAPWTGPPPLPPSPQNNPFVERPPDVLPSPAATLPHFLADRDLPRGFGDVPTEADASPGLFLAHPSEEQATHPAPALLGNRPLAFSTPFLQAALLHPKEFSFPSPVVGLAGAGGGPAPQAPLALLQPSAEVSTPPLSSVEAQQVEEASLRETASPHLVKPISSSSSTPGGEVGSQEQKQKQEEASLTPARRSNTTTTTTTNPGEKQLQPTPGRSSSSSSRRHPDSSTPSLQLEKAESQRDPSAKYYHLTHDELIQLLLKREAELSKKQVRVQELETYIDRLLVRIMEHSPTLLQVPLGAGPGEAEATTK